MVCSLSSKFKWIQENRNESRQSTRYRHTIKPQIDKSIPNSWNLNFIHSALHSDSVEQLCTAYNPFRVISLECPSMEFSFSLFSSTSHRKSVIFGYFSLHTQKKHRAVGKEWSTMCKQAIAAVVFIESPNGSSHSVQWLYNFKESVCNRRRNTGEKKTTNKHTRAHSEILGARETVPNHSDQSFELTRWILCRNKFKHYKCSYFQFAHFLIEVHNVLHTHKYTHAFGML